MTLTNVVAGSLGYLLCGFLWVRLLHKLNGPIPPRYAGWILVLWPLLVAVSIVSVLWSGFTGLVHLLGQLVTPKPKGPQY